MWQTVLGLRWRTLPLAMVTVFWLGLTLAQSASAQDGTIDPTFRSGGGPNRRVYLTVPQNDGKIIIVGEFDLFDGVSRKRIARLNPDGTLDTTFLSSGVGLNGQYPNAILVQPDGKILLGGGFSSFNGEACPPLIRLNPDGTRDLSFGTILPWSIFPEVRCLSLQSDGKILVGGKFTRINNVDRKNIARLNPDGTTDTSFNVVSPIDVFSSVGICFQFPDGKIMIGNSYIRVNGLDAGNQIRVNPDGTLDETFAYTRRLFLGKLFPAPSGKFYALTAGTSSGQILRLNADGTDDPTFFQQTNNLVIDALPLSGDRLVIVGDFTFTSGGTQQRLSRLNADGSEDGSFLSTTAPGADNRVSQISLQADGNYLICGDFRYVNGRPRRGLARISPSGIVDPNFFSQEGPNATVTKIIPLPDGKTLIKGGFDSVGEVRREMLARLNSDGTADLGFQPPSRNELEVGPLTVLENGKVLLGGRLTENGGLVTGIFRLNTDGTLDSGFRTVLDGPHGTICDALTRQPDGKILIAGRFQTINGQTRKNIARLNADGTLDTSFRDESLPGNDFSIYTISLQPDGKILYGGDFQTVDGSNRRAIVRLNQNGTLDTTFLASPGFTNPLIYSIATQSDGKILVGGSFSAYNDISRSGLVRLNADGSLDTGFQAWLPQTLGSRVVNEVVVLPNGKILIGGSFQTPPDSSQRNFARLNPDGTPDPNFLANPGADGGVQAIARQADGKILIGGSFLSVNGTTRYYLARLNACAYVVSPLAATLTAEGGTQSVSITSTGSCSWTAVSQSPWISVTSGSTGTGNGTVTLSIAANPGAQRVGQVLIADSVFTVTQESTCTFLLSPETTDLPASGGQNLSFEVMPSGNCPWTATSNAPWITITTGATGTGNGTVGFSVDANTNVPRTGTITAGGRSFTVNQASGCQFGVSPTSISVNQFATGSTFTVMATTQCQWTAVSNVPWITITFGATGTGNGFVSFSALANPGPSRVGTIIAAGQTVTVTQASSCMFDFSKVNIDFPAEGGTDLIRVTSPDICPWSVQSEIAWVTISPTTGSGVIDVQITARPNPGAFRAGFIYIANRAIYITQATSCLTPRLTVMNTWSGQGGDVTAEATDIGPECPRAAVTPISPWITLISDASLVGPGPIQFRVAPNPGLPRIGLIRSGNQFFTVKQDAKPAQNVGIFRPSTGEVGLRNQKADGSPDISFQIGLPGALPIAGDWNGDGVDSIGYFRDGVFYLLNSNTSAVPDLVFEFGSPGDIPVAGDWNGDGIDTVGIFRNGRFLLRNFNEAGGPNLDIFFGSAGETPIAGDWNGDGIDTIGTFDRSSGIVSYRSTNRSGNAEYQYRYGMPGDYPVVGDWNGDGIETLGLYRGNRFLLKNTNWAGPPDIEFVFGESGDMPLPGNWTGLP